MKALAYKNTKTNFVGWTPLHERFSRGYAYETDTHHVHMYGEPGPYWIVSPGLTFTEKKNGAGLENWVKEKFGADQIEMTYGEVGDTYTGIWRPGLHTENDVLSGLGQTVFDLRFAQQRLLLLIQRLDELLLFVEPTMLSLASAFSHKSRELLILACTAVEAQWRFYLSEASVSPSGNGFRTNDYFKLKDILHLVDFEVSLPRYEEVEPIRPFAGWKKSAPTKSLLWYDAYNSAKHEVNQLNAATLEMCIDAVAANVALFCARFGPAQLYGGSGNISPAFNSLFSVALNGLFPQTVYVPKVEVSQRLPDFVGGEAVPEVWNVKPFRI